MRSIKVIDSKSDAHRALICSFLANDGGKVICDSNCADIEATKACLEALKEGKTDLYCKESGSTLRFLLPVVAALGKEVSFHPEGRLPQRPLSPLYEELEKHGCRLSAQGTVPFKIQGQLLPGEYHLSGKVSSQFISGLLFALPLLNEDSEIRIEGQLESAGYIDMTRRTLQKFGVETERTKAGFFIRGGQTYRSPKAYRVEGDWSNAAFLLAAGALTEGGIGVENLDANSAQGDKAIVPILKVFGANVQETPNGVIVLKSALHGTEIDVAQIPDLVPVLALLGTAAEGKTVLKNAARLRLKESDRLESVSSVLRALGGDVETLADGLIITGNGQLNGGKADAFGDHRIVMMAAIASLICKDKVLISGADAVCKSYPDFFTVLEALSLTAKIERN